MRFHGARDDEGRCAVNLAVGGDDDFSGGDDAGLEGVRHSSIYSYSNDPGKTFLSDSYKKYGNKS